MPGPNQSSSSAATKPSQPNVLLIMTDNQRADTIAALGNEAIYTPNLDRLVRRGVSFDRMYTPCAVCIPARYMIRTGCEQPTVRIFTNAPAQPLKGQAPTMEGRCGPYLAKRMRDLGYRTFGIGKFHTNPRNEDLGYDAHIHSEELFATKEEALRDPYGAWLAEKFPEYSFIESPFGERVEMMYMPQMSVLPAHAKVGWWAADRAIEQIQAGGDKPFFGFVSFVGPHPALAPPIPFNRMYDPRRMPAPVCGDLANDHFDPGVPAHSYSNWAEDVSDVRARVLRARYYAEISYVDYCLGRILDALEASGQADNTLIAFFSDHGDHMGDHHAWGKLNFFDSASRVPLLVSWPGHLSANTRRSELASLTDIFGIATHAAGSTDARQGVDLLGVVAGTAKPRELLFGYINIPGTRGFKLMVREDRYKYIHIANGGREQLYDLHDDPHELRNIINDKPAVAKELRAAGVTACKAPGAADALENGDFKLFSFEPVNGKRIIQFGQEPKSAGFPENPGDVLKGFKFPS